MISLNGRPDPGVSSVSAYKSGPRQGNTSAPSLSMLRNPTLTNSKISLDTNVTSSVPIMIRPWLDGYEKQFAQGSILFVNIDEKAHRLSTVADIPTINYVLENAQRKPIGGVNQAQQAMFVNSRVPETFVKDGWNFFGIMRNDMAADSQLQKLLNVDVFGRAMIGNIFGPLNRGDHVGLALKYMDCSQNGGFAQPEGNLLPSVLIKGEGKKILQIVPTVNKKLVDEPDKSKKGDYEVHYPLGVVTHAVGRVPNAGQRKRALRSQNHFMLLPRIEILMI